MNNDLFTNKTIFNKDYFEIGEAVRVKDMMSVCPYDALILDVNDEFIRVLCIEIRNNSYEQVIHHIDIIHIEMGKAEIKKYNSTSND